MKKLVSLALAATMLGGTMLGLVACGGNTDDGDNKGNGGDNNGTTGSTIDSLYASLANHELKGVEGTVAMEVTSKGDGEEYKQAVEMNVAVDYEQLAFDFFGNSTSEYGSYYSLAFLRDGYVYSDSDEWEDVEVAEGNFDALLAEYKKDGGLTFDRESFMENTVFDSYLGLLEDDTMVKLLSNLPRVIGGTAAETTDGYTLTYDLMGAANELYDGFVATLKSATADSTLSELYATDFVQTTLSNLFYGITAKEFFDAYVDILEMQGAPEATLAQVDAVLELLPEMGTASVVEYLGILLDSAEFLSNVEEFAGSELPFDVESFGELTLREIGVSANEFNSVKEVLGSMTVTDLIASSVTGGQATKKDFDVDVTFTFDKAKQPTGLNVTFDIDLVAAAYDYEYETIVSGTAELAFKDSVTLADLKGCHYSYYGGALEEGTYEGTESFWFSYDHYDEEGNYEGMYQAEIEVSYTVSVGANNVFTVSFESEALGLDESKSYAFKFGTDDYLYDSEEEAHAACTFTDEFGGEHTILFCMQVNMWGYDNWAYVNGWSCNFSHWNEYDVFNCDFFFEFFTAELVGTIA